MACLVQTWHSISSSGLLESHSRSSSQKVLMSITPPYNGLWDILPTRSLSQTLTLIGYSPWPLIRLALVILPSLLVVISRLLALLSALVLNGVTPLSSMIGSLFLLLCLTLKPFFMEVSFLRMQDPLLQLRSIVLITLQPEVKLLESRSPTTFSIREPNQGIP